MAGRLKKYHDFLYLQVCGSHLEMGRQYGRLLQDEIQALYDHFDWLRGCMRRHLPLLARPFFPLVTWVLRRRAWRQMPQRFREELDGMAQTSGVSRTRLLSGTVLGTMLYSCTQIIAGPARRRFWGRNLDYTPPFLGSFPLLVEYRPRAGKRYYSWGICGYPGVLTGVNQDGVGAAVDLHFSPWDRSKRYGLPFTFRVREILEEAGNPEQARQVLDRPGKNGGWILGLAFCRQQRFRFYDIRDDLVHYSPVKRDKPAWVTNRYRSREMNARFTGVYAGEAEKNRLREERLAELLAHRHAVQLPEDMARILADSAFLEHRDCLGTFNAGINSENTLHSIVLDMNAERVWFSFGPGYAAWQGSHCLTLGTGLLVPGLPPHPKAATRRMREFRAFRDRLVPLFFARRQCQVLDLMQQTAAGGPMPCYMLDFMARRPGMPWHHPAVEAVLRRSRRFFPQWALPWKLEGERLLAVGNREAARQLLEDALKKKHLTPVTELGVLKRLVVLYQKAGLNTELRTSLERGCRLLIELGHRYRLEHSLQRLLRDWTRLLRSE